MIDSFATYILSCYELYVTLYCKQKLQLKATRYYFTRMKKVFIISVIQCLLFCTSCKNSTIQHSSQESASANLTYLSLEDSYNKDKTTLLFKPLATSKEENSVLLDEISKLKNQNKVIITIIIAFAILICCFIIWLIYLILWLIHKERSRKNEVQIKAQMEVVNELRHKLQDKEREYGEMNSEKQKAINELFEQRFTTLDNLCNTYYEYQGTKNEQAKIYNDVMKLISELGTDNRTLKELEYNVNLYKNNLMTEFRQAFPEISESDCTLYLYVVSGFSSRAISILIDEKIEVVYNRKSRLKQKISKCTAPNKELFLQYYN